MKPFRRLGFSAFEGYDEEAPAIAGNHGGVRPPDRWRAPYACVRLLLRSNSPGSLGCRYPEAARAAACL